MRPNRVKRLWREGKPAVGGWLSIPHCFAAEVMAHTGLDWLCVDMQHGCIDYSDVVPMLTAISTTEVTPFVRVPWNEPAMIMKVLDAGAYGVIVPMVSNRAEAERAVAACRYPPLGMRSNGPNRVLLYAGSDYQRHANDEIACVVMIETPEALDRLDEIVTTPGVDAAYIGPTDLALALGLAPVMDNTEPLHVAQVERIRAACQRAGIVAGIHTNSAAFTQRYIDQGFRFVMLVPDRVAMSNYCKAEVARLSGWAPMKPAGAPNTGGY
jgi:4-hydroxy-2-oxoheptanedioate aldolase